MSKFKIGDIVIVEYRDWGCSNPIAKIIDITVVTNPGNKNYRHEYCFVECLVSRQHTMWLLSKRLKHHYIKDFQDKIGDRMS